MADNTNNQTSSGFTLPTPSSGGLTAITTTPSGQVVAVDVMPMADQGPSSRDLLIGGAVLLILMVAFFFAKNAYATSLVRRRVEPRSANAAGWWLWVFLTLLSAGAVLAVVSQSVLMTPFIVIPLGAGAVIALILMLLASRR